MKSEENQISKIIGNMDATEAFMSHATESEVVAMWVGINQKNDIDPFIRSATLALITRRAQDHVDRENEAAYKLFTSCGIPVENTTTAQRYRRMNSLTIAATLIMLVIMFISVILLVVFKSSVSH